MSFFQIKIIYTYYAGKRTTPIFISEDELLSDDFQSFKDRLITEVPHLAKTCSPLQLTVLDDHLEVDLSPEYFPLQMRELLNKRKEITLQAFTFESPGDSEGEDNVHEDEDSDTPAQEIYLSPVDKLVEKTAEESFSVKPFALDMSRPACSKCHLHAGHTI
ncbi:Hypothetical predicted protein [Paramuricea clavata]|uniref:Uncharacterized protein n=1 Tax=Paramuricea clavata TaxID=317549 RepID=A0A6S7IE05_PARCT|nr:Hypothetical predicted protein [Paramuricea clavata]